MFFVLCSGDHREIHGLTHSFPTRRSSDLPSGAVVHRASGDPIFLARGREMGPRVSFHSPGVTVSGLRVADASRLQYFHLDRAIGARSEEHTSELQSLMRISYAVFCLKKKKNNTSNSPLHSISKQ